MKNNYDDFLKRINVSECEKSSALFYLRYRGVAEHDHVRQYLESVKGAKVSYSEIATTFRYDKRIRRVLFKYIGVIEEYVRAYINNNEIKIKYDVKEHKNKYHYLNSLQFRGLLRIARCLQIKQGKMLFPFYKNHGFLFSNCEALITFRNQICHNIFLLDNKKLKKCHIGDKSNSLYSNIINLISFLPNDFKDNIYSEIDKCSDNKESTYANQVNWNLPNQILVRIRDK